MIFPAIRGALKYALRPLLSDFDDQLRSPYESQNRLLKSIIKKLSATEYGRRHGVEAGDDYRDFAGKLPIVVYDELKDWLARQQETESRILTDEPIIFYEPTSGSAGAVKQIPYTKSLKASFNRMFILWLGDLIRHGPKLQTGKTFMSVTPAFRRPGSTPLGVRIGLEDDTEYLSGWARRLIKPCLVAPAAAVMNADPECFRPALAAILLSEPRLETISIWNPSFFELILSEIAVNADRIAFALRKGRLECGSQKFIFKPAAAERVRLVLKDPIDWTSIWPELKLISCWSSANAKPPAQRLGRLFPAAFVQGKGLLATEAPMTIPLIEAGGYAPLPAEVFYEFKNEEGRIFQLHELEPGRDYEIIITQKGGLYRYRIGDLVRATHYYHQTPCLDFIGRADDVCDLVGEKLNEIFVRDCLNRIPKLSGIYSLLTPSCSEAGIWRYILLIEHESPDAHEIASQLEELLCAAHHYRVARRLGQLDALEVRHAPRLRKRIFDYFSSKGMKLGDIKDRALVGQPDIAAWMA